MNVQLFIKLTCFLMLSSVHEARGLRRKDGAPADTYVKVSSSPDWKYLEIFCIHIY